MKKLWIFGIIFTMIFMCGGLTGCATTSKSSSKIMSDLENGEYTKAYRRAEFSIVHGNSEAANYVRLFKEKYPESKPFITAYYRNAIENSVDKLEFLSIPENMVVVNNNGLLTDADLQSLRQLQDEVATRRLYDGTLPLVQTDNYQTIPALTTQANEEVIFRNSVDQLISMGSNPLAEAVLKAVREKGPDSPQYHYLASHIKDIRLSKTIMNGDDFNALFPGEAQARKEGSSIKIRLISANGDDDNQDYIYSIVEYLEQNEQVNIMEEDSPDTYVVTLRKRRFRERELADRTETVRLATYEVNLIGAALLMPRNATYLYDVNTGGFSINYLFDVKLTQGSKDILKEKIQGKREIKYSNCSNARIRNVYGGESSAEFVANQNMQNRCNVNTSSVDVDAIYDMVMEDVASQILSLPPINNRLQYGM